MYSEKYGNHGKWNMDIFYGPSIGYRAEMCSEFWPDVIFDRAGMNWRELSAEIRRKTGISIPARKYFKFENLSRWEKIAGIDASHTRKSCIVTMTDRKSGWMACKLW